MSGFTIFLLVCGIILSIGGLFFLIGEMNKICKAENYIKELKDE